MPVGAEKIVPAPWAVTCTPRAKAAPTLRGPSSVSSQMPPPEQAPVQPVKTASPSAAALRDTFVPGAKRSAQSLPQSMPAGLDEILPPSGEVTASSTSDAAGGLLHAASAATSKANGRRDMPPVYPDR